MIEKNEAKRNAVHAWFEERIADCFAREQQLCAQSQVYQAALVRIECNAYAAFFEAFKEAASDEADDTVLGDDFKQKLILIPAPWHESVVKAVQRGDLEAAHVETRRIAAADDVKAAFYRIWEMKA